MLKLEENSKEPHFFVNDDITSLPARVLRPIQVKRGAKKATTVTGKLFTFSTEKERLVFYNLYKLQKWDPLLFTAACGTLNGISYISLHHTYF